MNGKIIEINNKYIIKCILQEITRFLFILLSSQFAYV